jgi:hypothetical protein
VRAEALKNFALRLKHKCTFAQPRLRLKKPKTNRYYLFDSPFTKAGAKDICATGEASIPKDSNAPAAMAV